MTIVVGFLCRDGLVIAADSMLTLSAGAFDLAQRTGKKLYALPASHVFAYAGAQGLGERLRAVVEGQATGDANPANALVHTLNMSASALSGFRSTLVERPQVNGVVGFPFGAEPQVCVFEQDLQPRLLNEHSFYVTIGNGSVSAEPFLKFLADAFLNNAMPTVQEAVFLACWVVQYTIDTRPGGVGHPIRIAGLRRNGAALDQFELLDADVEEHRQAITEMTGHIRDWRARFADADGDDAPAVPLPE